MDDKDRIAELERVLKMAQAELITLSPRLSQSYRANIEVVLAEIKKVLK